jgi:hypothetical protein
VERFCRLPSTIANAFSVLLGRNKQQIKMIMICLLVYLKHDTAYISAFKNDTVGFAVRLVNGSFYCFS